MWGSEGLARTEMAHVGAGARDAEGSILTHVFWKHPSSCARLLPGPSGQGRLCLLSLAHTHRLLHVRVCLCGSPRDREARQHGALSLRPSHGCTQHTQVLGTDVTGTDLYR